MSSEASKYYMDEHVARLIALQVINIIVLVFVNHRTYLIYILTLDFAIRAFTYWPSPLAFVAKSFLSVLNIQPKPVFAAPKKFAAGVGFAISFSISLLLLFDFYDTAYLISGILVFFALLEAFFKICAGCYLYNWLVAPILNRKNKLKLNK